MERLSLYDHFYIIVKAEKNLLHFSMPADFPRIKVESANVILIN